MGAVPPVTAAPHASGRGLLYAWAAYGIWGLFPLYWPLLRPASALEILGHRVVWSLLLVLGVLAAWRGLASLRATVADRRRLLALVIAAVFIAVNWFTYIWGVNNGHVVETSLGYYINPLVLVAMGVVVLHERLRPLQWAALGVGVVAVAVLSVDYGRPPWIALTLAVSFSVYGLAKKRAGAGALEGLAVETSVLVVPALAYLGWLASSGGLVMLHTDWWRVGLLVGAGATTALPLLFFGAAATRVPLSTLGIVQYVTPTIQLAIGVVAFREPMPPGRLAGFGIVWLALAVFTYDSLRARRRQLVAARTPTPQPATP